MDKRFKELRKELNVVAEDAPRIGPADAIPAADDVGYQAHDVGAEGALDKINWFVTSIGARSYLDPAVPMIRMKTKLNTIGLDFTIPKIDASGEYSVPLTQWGGRLGKDLENNDINDDGIVGHLGHGLNLNLNVTKVDAGWSIRGKIEAESTPVDEE